MMPGTTLGVYEIQALFGAGGVEGVYRANDIRLQSIVAIKMSRKLRDEDYQ